jgi:cytosine deaminase
VDLAIRNARLVDGGDLVDLAIADGRITAIGTGVADGPSARTLDAHGGLVTPAFVEPHAHLDKMLSRDRFGASTPSDAFAHARDVKRTFTVEDVEARASEALRLAIAHGIGRVRSQVDIDFSTKLVSFEGVLRARERYARSIDVDTVAFPQEGIVADPEAADLLREALRMGANGVGGLPEIEATVEDQRRHIETIFEIAEEADVPIDMHVDYQDEPRFKTLEMLADQTIERGYEGRVVASHCCALAVYPDDEAKRVIEKVKSAEIQVNVMPGNLGLLGGEKRTPYNRGVSRAKELLDAGVNVAAAHDNMYDIWYRFWRLDPAELGLVMCLAGGMRTDEEVNTAFEMVTTRAAQVAGAPAAGVREGEPADLVVFEAQSIVDVFRNIGGRMTIKAGRVVGGVEPTRWTAD